MVLGSMIMESVIIPHPEEPPRKELAPSVARSERALDLAELTLVAPVFSEACTRAPACESTRPVLREARSTAPRVARSYRATWNIGAMSSGPAQTAPCYASFGSFVSWIIVSAEPSLSYPPLLITLARATRSPGFSPTSLLAPLTGARFPRYSETKKSGCWSCTVPAHESSRHSRLCRGSVNTSRQGGLDDSSRVASSKGCPDVAFR
jgi:hypothetical protein